MSSMLTPTEALLQVAKSHPFRPAVRSIGSQWSYAALWARVRQIANQIPELDPSGSPVGLYMGLEIDYVAGAHAIWLSGRTVVFLSSKWTPEVLEVILKRASVQLVLHGSMACPFVPSVRAVSTHDITPSQQAPAFCPAPSANEIVSEIPVICSITPTSGSTGVPKSIVYPMRRSLAVLTEESSCLLKPMDGQWLRGGTTFLRPLFEIRRFMFNQTTLYLDPSCSVADQCAALCDELESSRNSQLLRVHFTPSVFRAFADFAQMRAGSSALPLGFHRVYWMVIGGESLSVQDLQLARTIFPSATLACNYACSEVGFAGISQMFVYPSEPIPSVVSFGPTQGCTDLVLLDDQCRVIPRTETGATGIVAFVTSESATHYLDNAKATEHMFRSWIYDEMLLYTDDIGCFEADGTIAIKGRSSRNVKVNGLFIDLDYVERAVTPAFADKVHDVKAFKLVKSNIDEKIIMFVSTSSASAMAILKHARDFLRSSYGDDLAMAIQSVRCIEEMPYNASYKIDIAKLQLWADSPDVLPPGLSSEASEISTSSKVDDLAASIAAEITKLCKSAEPIATTVPILYSGLNSITVVRLYFWLQSEYEYEEEMVHLFEEDVTAATLAQEILADELEAEVEEEVVIAPMPGSPESQATIVEDEVVDLYLEKKLVSRFSVDSEYSIESTDLEAQNRPVSVMVMQSSTIETVPESTNNVANHPTLHYSPISFLFVSWMTPLMWLGSKRPLLASDLLPLRRNDESIIVARWADAFWNQLSLWLQDRSKTRPSLFKSIFGAASRLWIISGLLWFVSVASAILAPVFLQQIIVADSAGPRPTSTQGIAIFNAAVEQATGGMPLFIDNTYALGGILMGLKLVFTIFGRSSDQLVKRISLNVKTALISSVYKKALKLSAESNQKYGKGYILNLVNVDCESVSKMIELAHQVWSVPIQLIVVVVLLSRILGVSVLAGVGVLLLSLLVLVMLVPIFMRRAAPWFMRLGDKRLKTIKEMLDGIRIIKVNGWEDHYLKKIEAIRTEQLGWLRQFNIGVALFVIVGQVANTIIPLAALSLFGRETMGGISAARIFPALSFFGMLVDPLIAVPQLLSTFVVASTSWGRLSTFLMAEEKTDLSSVISAISSDDIAIMDASFAWPERSVAPGRPGMGPGKVPAPAKKDKRDKKAGKKSDLTTSGHITAHIDLEKAAVKAGPKAFLHDINFSIKRGSLTAVVGSVGSGKSSLLSAITGEMMRVSGDVHCHGSIAYCAQQPWVQTTTIQENIVFGKSLDAHRLHRAISVTSFDSDLETFPQGLATELAEKGNNLSGGQKARLALSRAVYADADIYLLDDVLAALDPRVGRNVFNKCIKEALHGKTRLLVTHQLQYLKQVDHIIVVSDGGIVEQGSYDDLVVRNGELKRLLQDIQVSSKHSDEAEHKENAKAEKPKKSETSNRLIAEEERVMGAVSAATWWAYMKAGGGVPMAVMLLAELLIYQAGTIILSQWLTWWTEDSFNENINWWIGIYQGIGWGTVVLLVILNISILLMTIHASRVFHLRALKSVLAAPMWWFETQPIGRIMNRFSKDLESIDQRLMPQLFQLIAGIGSILSTIIILGYSTPLMLAFLGPMLIIYWFVLRFYRKSLRELKRLESTQRGPLQARFAETLDGIPTIAAYRRENDFTSAFGSLLNNSNRPTFLRFNAEIWVSLRMEILSSLLVFALVMLAHTKVVGSSNQFSLALTYASTLTYAMNLLLKSAANVESEMNSVERLMAYSNNLPKEPEARLGADPSKEMWPSRGEIVIRDVDAAYASRPDTLVLRDVNLTFKPGETVFIVGRTGSGKSTLLSLLLRMIEANRGSVEIDGRDITSLGVTTLRQGMQLIPQDPFIFSGTIRSALDFDGKHDDNSLWHALDLVGLKEFVSSQDRKLDTVVSDNGSNYSVGQRQLLCLAAAILRQPKILLLDEATASIDAGADVFIQQAMRRSCPDATILSVMHRLSDRVLETCDKVLVMEQGVPIEFASPKELLSRPNSMFSRLMAATRNH